MARKFKDILNESFNKNVAYRIKFAFDCDAGTMDMLEKSLAKYQFESATPWNKTPIQKNPIDFKNRPLDGPAEVCSTDVVIRYPINERLLEVLLALEMGVEPERIIVSPIDSPRVLVADNEADRVEYDADRQVSEEDAELNKEEQEHYQMENQDVEAKGESLKYEQINQILVKDLSLYGIDLNKELMKKVQELKDSKGENYYNHYPSKDEVMGDNLKPLFDILYKQHSYGAEPKHTEINQGLTK